MKEGHAPIVSARKTAKLVLRSVTKVGQKRDKSRPTSLNENEPNSVPVVDGSRSSLVYLNRLLDLIPATHATKIVHHTSKPTTNNALFSTHQIAIFINHIIRHIIRQCSAI
jgi:hypothetical protein